MNPMTDHLETRLRVAANGGDTRDLDDLMIEAADEIARLRERERRLVAALRKIVEDAPSTPDDWRYEIDLWGVGQVARAALNDTAAPAAEQEGE